MESCASIRVGVGVDKIMHKPPHVKSCAHTTNNINGPQSYAELIPLFISLIPALNLEVLL